MRNWLLRARVLFGSRVICVFTGFRLLASPLGGLADLCGPASVGLPTSPLLTPPSASLRSLGQGGVSGRTSTDEIGLQRGTQLLVIDLVQIDLIDHAIKGERNCVCRCSAIKVVDKLDFDPLSHDHLTQERAPSAPPEDGEWSRRPYHMCRGVLATVKTRRRATCDTSMTICPPYSHAPTWRALPYATQGFETFMEGTSQGMAQKGECRSNGSVQGSVMNWLVGVSP